MPEGQTDFADPPTRAAPTLPKELGAIRHRLVALGVKMVWNRDDAEDIVQEAFRLMLAKRVDAASESGGPWLWRTVCNLCLNHRRRRCFESLRPWLDMGTCTPPETAAAHTERLKRVRIAIAQLPEQQRVAIILRTMEGMDYAGIAGIMQVSQAAVRTHVHLARRKLAELLEDEEVGS